MIDQIKLHKSFIFLRDFFETGMKRKIDIVDPIDDKVVLNLGSGSNPIKGAVNLDLPNWNAADGSLTKANGKEYCGESVDIIHAHHFLEHIPNVKEILWECQRVLKVGGCMYITVPWWNCQMAHQDLNHCNLFSLDTWKELFNNPFYETAQGKTLGIWRFEIALNTIMGIKETNLAILTQLIKQ